jgi:hypothetical protein
MKSRVSFEILGSIPVRSPVEYLETSILAPKSQMARY